MTRTNREMVQIFLRICALVPGASGFSCRYALGPPLPVSLADWPFCSIFSSRFRPKQFLPLTFCFLLAPCFLLSLTGDFLLAVRPLALTFSYRCIRFLFFFIIECFPSYQACPMASLFSPSGTVCSQYHPRMLLRGSNYNHLLLLAPEPLSRTSAPITIICPRGLDSLF